MSSVFKVTVTGYRTPEGRKCNKHDAVTTDESGRKVLRPGYRRVKKKSRKWYGQYRDGKGRLRRVPLCRDKTASEQLLSKFITDAVLDKHGLVDRFEKHSGRLLTEHLADYRRELENRERASEYVELVISRLTVLMDGCGFRVIGDILASPVNDWLAAQRQAGETGVVLPPGKAWYTPKEAAAFLQISRAAIRAGIKRQGLEAVGHGKTRKFPRATVEALLERRSRGTSIQTTNYYFSHLKSFCRCLVEDGRMPESLFPRVRAEKVVDRRHDRRELTLDELKLLLKVTRSSLRSFRGLSGRDRFFVYVTACATGFRARAIASLTPESFELDSIPPTVNLAARFNKNRTPKE